MKRSAFRVFATLAATDEDIRKKIIETDNLMDLLVISLHETENVKLQMAAVGCLHSLSRSVQLLRTTFQVRLKNKIERFSLPRETKLSKLSKIEKKKWWLGKKLKIGTKWKKLKIETKWTIDNWNKIENWDKIKNWDKMDKTENWDKIMDKLGQNW